MAWFKRSSNLTLLAVTLTLCSGLNVSAQVPPRSSSSSLGNQLVNAFRAPDRGAPVNRQGGGTRGPCFKDEQPLTALVPRFASQTAAENLTVVWYMPEMTNKNGEAPTPAIQFTLKDDSDREVYSVSKPLTKSTKGVVGTPGIMSLTITSPYPLKIGEEYTWELRVMCDSQSIDRSDDQFVTVPIKRVAPNPTLATRLQQATPEERTVLYAEAQLWYELLANLFQLLRDRPNDPNLTEAWKKLLAEVDLQEVSQQPVLQSAEVSVTNTP